MSDKKIKDYICEEMTGEEFCELFPDLSKRLVKLTNIEECHNGFQFKTGLNEDTIPFDPTGQCKPGGIYFTDINNLSMWLNYSLFEMKYCRDVTLPSDCRVYIEQNKFKADKIILDDRVDISELPHWSDKEYCMNAIKQEKSSIRYIRDINNDIQLTLIRTNPLNIIYLLEHNVDISEESKLEAVKDYKYAIMHLSERNLYVSKEVQLAAVENDYIAIKYLLKNKVKVPEEVQLAALKKDRNAIEWLINDTYDNVEVSEEVRIASAIRNKMYGEMTFEEFRTKYPYISNMLVKLTNKTECHNGFQFKTGLNVDTVTFNPTSICKAGGIYFTDVEHIEKWLHYNGNKMKYCRNVILPPDCRIYVEENKFKADKIILGERVKIKDFLGQIKTIIV